MLRKRIITAFLVLVILFQALPVKHLVKYFSDDNLTAEEALPESKSETKSFKLLDDHNFINEFSPLSGYSIAINNSAYFHFTETLPDFHTEDIQTPPPNKV